MLPDGFDADGKLTLPATTTTRRFSFRITPGQTPETAPPTVTLSFTVDTPAPTQRAVIEYQGPISFFSRFTQTIFFQRSLRMLFFQYGKSDDGKEISKEVFRRIGPSLSISIPVLLLGLLIDIVFAMMLAVYRGTYLDYWGVILCVLLMSISALFYIIGGQAIFAKDLRLVPISGFDYGVHAAQVYCAPGRDRRHRRIGR